MPHYSIKVEPSSNAVSQVEFSRILGVTAPTVNEFKRDGRLVLLYSAGRDKVLVKESIDRLNATMKLHGVFRNRQAAQEKEELEKPIEELKTEVNSTQLDLETQDAETLFRNAKALKEKAMALQVAAEHEKFIGSLVEREQVEKLIFERGRQFRDGLVSMSRRIAPQIAGNTDIPEIEKIIANEVRSTLEDFCKLPQLQ